MAIFSNCCNLGLGTLSGKSLGLEPLSVCDVLGLTESRESRARGLDVQTLNPNALRALLHPVPISASNFLFSLKISYQIEPWDIISFPSKWTKKRTSNREPKAWPPSPSTQKRTKLTQAHDKHGLQFSLFLPVALSCSARKIQINFLSRNRVWKCPSGRVKTKAKSHLPISLQKRRPQWLL